MRGYVPEQLGWLRARAVGLDWLRLCGVFCPPLFFSSLRLLRSEKMLVARAPLRRIIYSCILSPLPLAVDFFKRRQTVAVRRAWASHMEPASLPPPVISRGISFCYKV